MAGEVLHEDRASLTPELLDRHRAISNLIEELEAIDWYDQRIAASDDQELKQILGHNREEEKEHASMLLEWLRRHDAELDGHLRNFLFSQGPIREKADGGGANKRSSAAAKAGGSLSIGSLRG
jgi:ferritin-like protein